MRGANAASCLGKFLRYDTEMADIDQRGVLERLIRDRRDDYANLSRLLGRNPAYVQQFVKRGVPRKLDEGDRRRLAAYFGIADTELGGPVPSAPAGKSRLKPIPRYALGASAGPGALHEDERPVAHIGFDPAWLRRLGASGPDDLSIIRVEGDSMFPALGDGDDILVDRGDGATGLRDGIYVLRRDDALIVKRLAIHPATRRITVGSDNPAHPTWPDCDPASIDVIGRVIWAGRKIG